MEVLADKVAIITGASSGIGRATAKLFAKEGASVIVGARRGNELEKLVEEITHSGGMARALIGDVTSENYHRSLVELALSSFGQLDIAHCQARGNCEICVVSCVRCLKFYNGISNVSRRWRINMQSIATGFL